MGPMRVSVRHMGGMNSEFDYQLLEQYGRRQRNRDPILLTG